MKHVSMSVIDEIKILESPAAACNVLTVLTVVVTIKTPGSEWSSAVVAMWQ